MINQCCALRQFKLKKSKKFSKSMLATSIKEKELGTFKFYKFSIWHH